NKLPERRVLPVQLVDNANHYDVEEYLKLMVDAIYTILSPFGFTKKRLMTRMLGQSQSLLN
ncbi:MAG: hypothetical protein OEZ48_17430, partial [Candidatus Bathyarchaeota archaeon]|nr:hypothetical protein [Candidatus Bathyarchaeota archaeon]